IGAALREPLLSPIRFAVVVEDEYGFLHLPTIFLDIGRILNLDACSVNQRNSLRLDVLFERVYAGLLALASIEDRDCLPDTLDDGVLLSTVRMQNIVVEVCPAGFKVNILCICLHDLTVRLGDL